MPTRLSHLPAWQIEPAEKVLRTAIDTWNVGIGKGGIGQRPRVFVTVSREPGAGALSFSHRLAERLNADGEGDWSAWDRELVEKVSAEHGIGKQIIELIESTPHGWLNDLLMGFAGGSDPPDVVETRAYKRVAMTLRTLAAAGHAILVGRGSNFITQDLPGGIHLRLVAPLAFRVKSLAERENLTPKQAAGKIAELTRLRSEFYRRYWPGKMLAPEGFNMTLNVSEMSLEEMIDCALPLIRARDAGAVAAPAAEGMAN
jgi:cytidylate kinase-like protein